MSMTLRDYLYVNRRWLTTQDFAKKVGGSRFTIGRIAAGSSMPSIKMAKAIEKATNGEVKCYEMMEYCWKLLHDSHLSPRKDKKKG